MHFWAKMRGQNALFFISSVSAVSFAKWRVLSKLSFQTYFGLN